MEIPLGSKRLQVLALVLTWGLVVMAMVVMAMAVMAMAVVDMDMVTDMVGVIHVTDMVTVMVTDMAGDTQAGDITLLITLDIILLITLVIMDELLMEKDMQTTQEELMVVMAG